jgi:cytochrome P450
LLDEMAPECDFIATFAFPLPIAVIGELLGVPRADQSQFQHLARDWTQVLDVTTPRILARADVAAGHIREYLAELAKERRQRPREDLLSAMQGSDGQDPMNDDELLTMAALLFAAGFETATHLLGNGLVALLNHPDQRDLLAAKPDLAAGAADELLRFDSSVQIARRKVLRDTIIGGVKVSAGERLIVCLGAANHDPERFTDPGTVDIGRPDNRHLAFSAGIHFCLGGPLARLEAAVFLEQLVTDYSGVAFAGDPVRHPGIGMRSFDSLPVTLTK